MSFRNNRTHLQDIVEGIDLIEAFVGDISLDAYKADPLRKSAVERQLQIITEAAKRLGDDAYALCPDEDWKGFCRMGDLLRHVYHRIDDEIIWDTVKEELPKMKVAAMEAIRKLPSE